jgi:hypothetical protein
MSEPDVGKHQESADPDVLQKALIQLLEQVSKRDQKIAERETLLLYTQTQLREKESQLHEIVTSRIWKMVLFIRRIHIFLVSPNNRRVQMLRRGSDLLLSRFKKIEKN